MVIRQEARYALDKLPVHGRCSTIYLLNTFLYKDKKKCYGATLWNHWIFMWLGEWETPRKALYRTNLRLKTLCNRLSEILSIRVQKSSAEDLASLLTCKLSIRRPSASKLSHQLSIGLKDEDTAGFVIHSDDMSVFIHGHSFGTHETACTNLILW